MALSLREQLEVAFSQNFSENFGQKDVVASLNSQSGENCCHSPLVLTQLVKYAQSPSQENAANLRFSLGSVCDNSSEKRTDLDALLRECDSLLVQCEQPTEVS